MTTKLRWKTSYKLRGSSIIVSFLGTNRIKSCCEMRRQVFRWQCGVEIPLVEGEEEEVEEFSNLVCHLGDNFQISCVKLKSPNDRHVQLQMTCLNFHKRFNSYHGYDWILALQDKVHGFESHVLNIQTLKIVNAKTLVLVSKVIRCFATQWASFSSLQLFANLCL